MIRRKELQSILSRDDCRSQRSKLRYTVCSDANVSIWVAVLCMTGDLSVEAALISLIVIQWANEATMLSLFAKFSLSKSIEILGQRHWNLSSLRPRKVNPLPRNDRSGWVGPQSTPPSPNSPFPAISHHVILWSLSLVLSNWLSVYRVKFPKWEPLPIFWNLFCLKK